MIKARLAAFLADRKGGVIIYVALAMPVLVGGMGLGAETGYRYYNQRLLQHAADVAAHAGAVRMYQEKSDANVETAALNVATGSGFMSDIGIVPVSHVPPTGGDFMGDPSAVEVILTETRPRLFSAIFSEEPVVIAARAVAAVTGTGQPACILALSGTSPGAVTVTGNNTTILEGCSVASNSTSSSAVSLPNGAAVLDVECISTPGGISTNVNAQVHTDDCMLTGTAPVQDPYYWVQEPAFSGSCTNNKNVTSGDSINAVEWQRSLDEEPIKVMCFKNGFDVKSAVDLKPGLYIIDGGKMTLNANAVLSGTGVTFYFTNGAEAKFNGSATVKLSAPTTGPYAGILFFGDRSDTTAAHSILGNSDSFMEGAIYTPASHVEFSGNSADTDGCTQVIANTVTLTGSSTVTADCSDDSVEEILVGNLISIVE